MAALSAPSAPALAAAAPRPVPYVITLDPGHGGSADNAHPERLFDPGVQAVNGLLEKDLTLSIARRVRDRLTQLGVHVVMTRNSDTFLDITPRIQAANAAASNLYVSIHLNYFGDDPSVGGSLVLYPNAASEPFANTMAATLGRKLAPIGIPGDGVQLKNDLWTTAQMPAVTVECAFLSNLNEANLMKKSSTLDTVAGGIVSGIEAQLPQLQGRGAQIVAYNKAHVPAASSTQTAGALKHNPLMPWVPLAILAAVAYVFRRQLVPALAMIIAIVGMALGRFNAGSPDPRRRSGVRRRRSRARLWGPSAP